jgi:Alpha-2-macroglobulin family
MTDPLIGEASIAVKAPESITTFEFAAVSMNDRNGLGLTGTFTSLKVFQDFFIQLTLPYQCKRTETVTLNIIIFSFLPNTQSVTVSVARKDTEFTVVNPAFNGWNGKFLAFHIISDFRTFETNCSYNHQVLAKLRIHSQQS